MEILRDLCEVMTDGSLCAMGGLTPLPVLSALRHFPEDFGGRRSRWRRSEHRPMTLIKEIDYGTPIRVSDNVVALTIDGQSISVPAGTWVMAAAMKLGTQIPKLCATDSLEPFGSCRLCLVEIEGRRGTPASCTTPAETGMVVHTQNAKLAKLRKGVMELYISDHPLDCLTCSANGDCELQDMAGAVGLREVRYDPAGANHFHADRNGAANELYQATDVSNPYFAYDPAKCIVCNRCVRACEEVQGTFALTISGRGFDSRVAAGGWISSPPIASPAAPACRPARRRRWWRNPSSNTASPNIPR